MPPYNATDMIRAMHRDHGLAPDAEANDRRGHADRRHGDAPLPTRIRRWIGAVTSSIALF